MRVAVVGHRGLIGSAIADHFARRGADVTGIDRRTTARVLGPFDLVVNAAGSSDKRLATTDPRVSFQANVADVLTTLIEHRCGSYLHVSSVSVYEDVADPSATAEHSSIDPARLTPYGAFKLMGEQLVLRYAPRWVILRVGNVVGPGLRKNPIYDLLARRTVFVSPASTMSFIDTRDVARIAWQLRSAASETFNVAGHGVVSLAHVASQIGVELGSDVHALPLLSERISVDKLAARMTVPQTLETVARFIREWRDGTISLGD